MYYCNSSTIVGFTRRRGSSVVRPKASRRKDEARCGRQGIAYDVSRFRVLLGVSQDRVRRVLRSSATPIDKRNTKATYRSDCPLDEKQKYCTRDTPMGHATNSQCGRTASTYQPSIAATSRNVTSENKQRAENTRKNATKLSPPHAIFHI